MEDDDDGANQEGVETVKLGKTENLYTYTVTKK